MKFRFIALKLSILCILMFLFQAFFGSDLVILDKSIAYEEIWRFVTSIFAHSSMGHLLSNLFALSLFGLILEGRIGGKRVFWLFIISGVLINIFTPYSKSLGASGAIFAILGVLMILRPWMLVWAVGVPMPMILAGLVWLVQDVAGIFVPSNIGHLAHISGLFFGLLMGKFWKRKFGDKKKRKRSNHRIDKKLKKWEKTWMK